MQQSCRFRNHIWHTRSNKYGWFNSRGGLLQRNMKMTAPPPSSSCNISQQLTVVSQGWNMGISFQEMLNDFSVLLDLNRNWKTCGQEFYALNPYFCHQRHFEKSFRYIGWHLYLDMYSCTCRRMVCSKWWCWRSNWMVAIFLGMIMDELMYPESIRRCSITWLLVHPSRSWFPEQITRWV